MLFFVLVSLTQLVWTMHNICKVRGSNPGHHKKKTMLIFYQQYNKYNTKSDFFFLTILIYLKV